MKLVILAGGLGTRISEETEVKPKPMVEIGGMPIIWHIMKYYHEYGVNEFIICCGYKGYVIKEYFSNYFLHKSDVTFDMINNEMIVHDNDCESWRVSLVDTGPDTQTGGRLKRVYKYIKDDDFFFFTYGDGLSNVNIKELAAYHQSYGKKATLTSVKPPGRYGALSTSSGLVEKFTEKPAGDGGYINGGFFVLSPSVVDLIEGDDTSWEADPLNQLASSSQLMAFEHNGFWQAMDTLREKNYLENLWMNGNAPWKIW